MLTELFIAVAGFFLLGAIMLRLIHRQRHCDAGTRQGDWLKYGVFILVVTLTLVAGLIGRIVLTALLCGLALAGSFEISRPLRQRPIRRWVTAGAAALVITFSLGHLVMRGDHAWFGYFAFVFLLVATMDSYSQLWGRLMGQRRMTPRISPAKTWEGFVGGILSTLGAALIFGFLVPPASVAMLALYGLIIALSATAGDLAFSAIKRIYAIKDYSSALPGHGGILDRFDSLIVAAPIFYWATFALSLGGGPR